MADKEKYVIKIQGQLVEVSPEVYYAYFHMERQERWQEEKQLPYPESRAHCNTTNTPCALPEAGYAEIRAGETH